MKTKLPYCQPALKPLTDRHVRRLVDETFRKKAIVNHPPRNEDELNRIRFRLRSRQALSRGLQSILTLSLMTVTVAAHAQRHYHTVNLGRKYNFTTFLNRTSPLAMNGDGVLGGNVYTADAINNFSDNRRAFLLKNQTITLLPYFGLNASTDGGSGVLGINRRGQAAGYSHVYGANSEDRGVGAFFWNNGTFSRLPDFGSDGFGATNTRATAINDNGDIVGSSETYNSEFLDTGPLAFLYHNGVSAPIGDFGTDHNGFHYSYATNINSSGQIGGYAEVYDASHNDTGQQAFLYDNGTVAILPPPIDIFPSINGVFTTGINDSGQVVGYAAAFPDNPYATPTQSTACVWTSGSVAVLPGIGLNYYGYNNNYAYAINNSGDIVGSSYSGDTSGRNEQHGVLWHNGSPFDVNTLLLTDTVATVSEVSAISDGGRLGAQAYFTYDIYTLLLVPVAGGNFNGDGRSDVVFQNQNTGEVGLWFLDKQQFSRADLIQASIPVNYQLAATPDLNGDGYSDLVFRDANTGDILYWLLNGTTVTVRATLVPAVSVEWRVVGSADVVGDGYTDLIFQNQTTGDLAYWQMRGTAFIASHPLTTFSPGPNWQVAGLADLNRDGSDDLIFRNTQTGDVGYWFLHGDTLFSSGLLATGVSVDWTLGGVGDVNGDGSVALLWQNVHSGEVAAWWLEGTLLTGTRLLASDIPAWWQLAGPR